MSGILGHACVEHIVRAGDCLATNGLPGFEIDATTLCRTGWMMSHNAIRLDMSDFAEATDAVEKQVRPSPSNSASKILNDITQ